MKSKLPPPLHIRTHSKKGERISLPCKFFQDVSLEETLKHLKEIITIKLFRNVKLIKILMAFKC